MLYVLARSLQGGRRVGLASSFGTALGGMFHVAAAAFGLSLLLARSAMAFALVKYCGAAYLVYLGVKTLMAKEDGMPQDAAPAKGSPFLQGVLTEMLNPKTALFFLAFIPQFVDHTAPLVPQFLLLGTLSVTLNTLADLAVVLATVPLARRLKESAVWRRRQRRATGAVLIGLGGYVAVGAD
jgi:threonine/homoserine/homoserine lactone efflux protein